MVLSTGFVTRTSALYIDFLPSNPRIPAPPADIIAIALRSHSPRALGNSSRWQCNHHSHPYNNIYLRHNHRCMRLSGLTSYVTSRLPRLRSRLLPSAMQHGRQADVDDPSTAVSVLVDASQSKHGSTTHSYRHKRPPHSGGQGILALLGVALLWGTYAPSFKYLFLLEHAPSPALAIAVQATLCALFLFTTVLISDTKEPVIKEHADGDSSYDSSDLEHSQLLPRPLNSSTAAAVAAHRPERLVRLRQPLQRLLRASSNRLHIAGAELGCWSFLGNALASLGLSLTTATKAAFLTQATGFMVPVLSYLSGEVVGVLIWLSCGLGAVGSSLVAVDSARIDTVAPVVALATASTTSAGAATAAAGAAAGASARGMLADAAAGAGAALADTAAVDTVLGEWLTLAACLFYALSTVRIGVYSRRFGGNELAFMSQAAFALLALVWLCCDIMAAPQGVAWQMQHIAKVFRNHTAVAVMLWIGLGPGAMASLLQMWGQKLVPASQAQVIFSSTPLWAGIIAQSVLKGEAMGMQGWIGSSVIIVATLLAAFVDVVAPAQSSSSSSSGAPWQKTSGGGAAGHKAADES